MSSSYPAALDNVAANKTNATREDLDHPTHHNKLADGLNAVQNTLGVNPQGTASTVAERFERAPEVLAFKGSWNPSTNTPTLADGTATPGDAYIASVGASRNLGSGSITFDAGDYVVYNQVGVWEKISGSILSASANEVITGTWRFDGGFGMGRDHTSGLASEIQMGGSLFKSALHADQATDWAASTLDPYDLVDLYMRSTGDGVYVVNWGGLTPANTPGGLGTAGGMACFNALIPMWLDAETGGSVENDRSYMVGLRIASLAPNEGVQGISMTHNGGGAGIAMEVQNPAQVESGSAGGGGPIVIDDYSPGHSIAINKHVVPDWGKAIITLIGAAGDSDGLVLMNESFDQKLRLTTHGTIFALGAVQAGPNGDVTLYGGGSRPEIILNLAGAQNSLYIDTSGGKHRLMCQFPTGAAQQVAIEP